MTAPLASLPRLTFTYDSLKTLVDERAPLPGDVVTLSPVEFEALVRLSGTRRRRTWFGRKVVISTVEGKPS